MNNLSAPGSAFEGGQTLIRNLWRTAFVNERCGFPGPQSAQLNCRPDLVVHSRSRPPNVSSLFWIGESGIATSIDESRTPMVKLWRREPNKEASMCTELLLLTLLSSSRNIFRSESI